jgi:hypothetical protein
MFQVVPEASVKSSMVSTVTGMLRAPRWSSHCGAQFHGPPSLPPRSLVDRRQDPTPIPSTTAKVLRIHLTEKNSSRYYYDSSRLDSPTEQAPHATPSMICDFERWNANIGELAGLQDLSGTRVGIEAADYLTNRILNHPRTKEPLVPALGGLPLALQQYIEADLDVFKREGIEPRFVFSGLDVKNVDNPFEQKQDEAAVNANAWNLYDSHQAEASVAKFGESSELYATCLLGHSTDGPSLRHRRGSLPRAAVRPHSARAALHRRTIQRMGPGTTSTPAPCSLS